jgi:hypothetical protein
MFFIDFLDELGLFVGEKPNFTKKNFVALPSAGRPPSDAIS